MPNKYVFKLRRGTKYVDENGGLLLNEDGTVARDDWTEYTDNGGVNPLDGELVLEYEENPNTGKKTPRLKIGDGVSTFAELEYISVDSFILPKTASVHIDPAEWKQADDEDDDRYYQVVTVQNAVVTKNSKVDLQPSSDDLTVFHEKDLAFVAENWDGQVRVYCIGQVPQKAYDIPVTITEVVCND
jgi:hypothetical protein